MYFRHGNGMWHCITHFKSWCSTPLLVLETDSLLTVSRRLLKLIMTKSTVFPRKEARASISYPGLLVVKNQDKKITPQVLMPRGNIS